MTCPGEGKWYKNEVALDGSESNTKDKEIEYNESNKGLYKCEYSSVKYYFYVQGKGE